MQSCEASALSLLPFTHVSLLKELSLLIISSDYIFTGYTLGVVSEEHDHRQASKYNCHQCKISATRTAAE